MTELINIEPWWRFGAALLIGALIGLEREFVQQREEATSFAGIRTFSLIALLGAVTAFASAEHGIGLFLVVYAGLTTLIVGNHIVSLFRGKSGGTTTEVAALLTPLFGALVVWGYPAVAAALAVITALLLTLKPRLHEVARRMTGEDLRATIQFALIAAVVLPILPNEPVGPFGVLSPFRVWMIVVFVSGISFAGYLLMKVLGPKRGIGLTGLLGGVVSSTATTISFADRSRENPALSLDFSRAIMLASIVMFPRIVVLVLFINPPLTRPLLLPVAAMLLANVGFILWQVRRPGGELEGDPDTMTLGNPLRITTAITFALMFAVVLILVQFANELFGTTGVYVASAVSGLAGIDTITLSASELSAVGRLEPRVAVIAIILAALTNTILKAGIASVLGARNLRRRLVWPFTLIVLVGILASGPYLFAP